LGSKLTLIKTDSTGNHGTEMKFLGQQKL